MPAIRPLSPYLQDRFHEYLKLIRFDRPIGTFLLLWPTLWALWLAGNGAPAIKNVIVFTLGVFLMRSAGCVINDFADRNIDGKVERTKLRPLATGNVTAKEALILFAILSALAFVLVLQTNTLTVAMSFGGILLASCYPFMKRYTYLPQVVLGAAFAWAVPMAYAAETSALPAEIWLLYLATLVWTIAYDTIYAMVDKEDDVKIGVKSTAILFGHADKVMVAFFQALTLLILYIAGTQHDLSHGYHLALVVTAVLFIYQQHLLRYRVRSECFKAFLNNNWVGLVILAGIITDTSLF